MKNILLLYTGGTIGMVPTANGYSPRAGYFRGALEAVPELHHPRLPHWDFMETDPILDSSNIAVEEWNKIGAVIAENYERYDGFVIMHGTDTMAYTASALSFMLENLSKPVILTGSQIPLCEIRSDGRDNLITSLLIAADERVHEVCLYFGGKLLRGNRSTKYSADGMMASQPNAIGLKIREQLEFEMPPFVPIDAMRDVVAYQLIAIMPGEMDKEVGNMLSHCRLPRWHPAFTDIVAAGNSKAAGMEAVCRHFGIRQEETLAFGDGGNDIEMLQWAGIGVAMGNAADDVKGVADMVTTDVDNEGIENAVNRLLV